MRLQRLLFGLAFACVAQSALAANSDSARASVVQIRAHHGGGRVTLGSAVIVAPGRAATNAHVVSGATTIEISSDQRTGRAALAGCDVERDVCLLELAGLDSPARMRSSTLRAGETVYAIGFPAERSLKLTRGEIVALHDYDGANVVQVSASFDYGESGGGLFDEDGRVIGLLTFKARAGGAFHFVVPIAWLAIEADRIHSRSRVAFWQRKPEALPYFLRAASLEANGNWTALAALAREWMTTEPANAVARATYSMATGKASASPSIEARPTSSPVLSEAGAVVRAH